MRVLRTRPTTDPAVDTDADVVTSPVLRRQRVGQLDAFLAGKP